MLALNSSIVPLKLFGVEMQHDVAALLPLPPADEAQHGNASSTQSHSSSSESRSKSTTPELKFVTLTGPPSSRSKESRLVVRSHAMQAFLREKKNDGMVPTKKEPDSQVKKLDDALGRFKLASWSRKSTKKASAVAKGKKSLDRGNGHHTMEIEASRSVGIVLSPQVVLGQLDPFGILPITMTSQTHSLLYHYTTSFTMNSAAVNPEGSWLAFAITDAALLHALLSLVAYHFDLTQGRDESPDSLYQKGEALREMKKRLNNDSHRQTSDATIATVSLFTNLETMTGTRNHADIHMAALERMVGMRGGLDKFGHNKVLQRVLIWSDILYSSTWHCKTRFPLLQSYKSGDPIAMLDRFSSDFFDNFIQYDAYEVFPSNLDVFDVFEMLRRISRAITGSLSPPERLAVSNQIYLLENTLLSSPNAPEIHEFSDLRIEIQQTLDFGLEADLSEPFRIAALLYIHVILRELPRTARMHRKLVSSLRLNLEERSATRLSSTSQHTLEILAWICFIGGIAASGPVERYYFVTLLNQICGGLNINSKAALWEMLRGVLWRDDVCEGYFAGFWEEVTLLYEY